MTDRARLLPWRADKDPAQPELCTLSEVERRLGIGRATLRLMIRDGELPALRVRGRWHVRRADVDAWIEKKLAEVRRYAEPK
jgi:excisionase family DNA binding protein